MDANQEMLLGLQIGIDVLQAKLDKKKEINQSNVTLDEGVLYSKRLALAKLLEAQE